MNSFNDDFDYIHAQFTTTPLNIEYTEQVTQDPWYQPLDTNLILQDVYLPSIYNQVYQELLIAKHQEYITLSILNSFLEKYIDTITSKKIISLIGYNSLYSQQFISQDKFNLALALLACSQRGLDVSLDTIQQNREDLPIPQLDDFQQLNINASNSTTQVSSSVVSVSSLILDPQSVLESVSSIDSASSSLPSPLHAIYDHSSINSDNDKNKGAKKIHNINSKTNNKTVKDYQWYLELDLITIKLIPQKQGRIFKHVNYLMKSQLNQTAVKRRFTEFYILWESLIKRYPLRIVPNIPPKKIQGNDAFLEKRRRGLTRFMNAIVRHEVLSKDELVQAFLTNEDFQNWYNINQPSLEDEYIRTMPDIDSLRSKIPHDINDKLKRLQQRLKPAIEQYNKMITAIQQLTFSEQAIANDLTLYSVTLSALNEINQQFNDSHCNPCQNINNGQLKVANTIENIAGLLDDKSLAMLDVFLEQIKYHRDLFLAVSDMLDRKNQLCHSIHHQRQIIPKPIAAKIIMSYKTSSLSSSSSSPNHIPIQKQQRRLSKDQIDTMLESDYIKETLQQHRLVFIHYSLASELIYIHQQQAFLSMMYQKFVHQQCKLAQQEHRDWMSLQKQLEFYLSDHPDDFS
ncbi:hypothetical protein BJ944DRAFT_265406 [Cunninghamella echinulata]|nr:hypothetical protein BJ944DRAFT_265406 [Cunninghamella echinulata]